MKKGFAWILIVALLCLTGAQAAIVEADEERETGIQWGTELVLGAVTPLTGFFATDLWGMNASDIDVRDVLHGYPTVTALRAGGMGFNPTVVTDARVAINDEGGQTYTLTIATGLTYNDGTPISAADYAFAILLYCSPQIREIGGAAIEGDFVVGISEYLAGEAKTLTGIRLLRGNAISISVMSEYSSYFYDIARLNIVPFPISVIAPGCEVRDDGNGVYVGRADKAPDIDLTGLSYTPGEFSADMLRATLLDPETGYVFNPRVTSGAYMLDSYDPVTHAVRFVINERYAGNHEGITPRVEKVVFRQVQEETMVSELEEGTVDVLVRVTSPSIAADASEKGFRSAQYWRTGFAMVSFACEDGPASSVAVRQAIARCVDKDELIRLGLDGTEYAMPVHGYYGRGQWMVNQVFPADEELEILELNVPEELEELAVPYNLEEAKALLESDGWSLNASGEEYQAGDGIRYRSAEGALEPLTMHLAKPLDYPVADVLQVLLEKSFAEVGIGLEITDIAFDEMLIHYFRMTDRTFDMFFLANNFYYLFDPYYDFHTDEAYQGTINVSGLRDEELMNLGLELTNTTPGDMRAYVEKWIVFQNRWVEMMPLVPLYSNRYYDFRANDVQGYYVNEQSSWVHALPEVYIGEAEETDIGVVY